MQEIKATYRETIERTQSIHSFRFVPEKPFLFTPGQFVEVVFDEQNRQNRQANKYLSFSCAPGKEYIEVTKRFTGSIFSRQLEALKVGQQVLLRGPLGTCVFRDEYPRIGFLIGGIGITPVISILEYVVEKRLDTDILLFYSSKTEQEIAFKKEIDRWSTCANIKTVYTLTECVPKTKECLFGVLNKEFLSGYMQELYRRTNFIFGPPKMVEEMQQVCRELGCLPEKIKVEQFMGY